MLSSVGCFARTFIVVSLVFATTFASRENTCPVVQYTGNFNTHDHVLDHALLGKSYKNLTVDSYQKCFSVCVHDCRCVSYQMKGSRCELIDENRHTAPDSYKEVSGYKYWELKQKFKDGKCLSQCYNGCCRSDPCENGGTCIELCQNVTRKFQCKCLKGFTGRVCDQYGLSCASYDNSSEPSIRTIQTREGRVKVLCDSNSEPGIVWTLIESFAFSLNNKYKGNGFMNDFPVNTNNFNWQDYRLSRSVMIHTLNHSSHWRATCNYNSEGLVKRDYIRGRLSKFDVITKDHKPGCIRVEYINVRGINCTDCTTHARHTADKHVFVDSGRGKTYGCDINFLKGSIKTSYDYCDNFGKYTVVNPAHRCTATPNSTTQWWLGSLVAP